MRFIIAKNLLGSVKFGLRRGFWGGIPRRPESDDCALAHPVEKNFTQTPSLVITEGRRFSFLPGFFGFLWFSFGFWFSFRFSFV